MDDNLIIPDPQPSRADAVRNRATLLETAERLFEEHGVEAVSMTQVAECAGVGKGTLYRHFRNKTDLCHALLDKDMQVLQDQTLTRLRSTTPPQATLRWFLERVAFFVERNGELLQTDMTADVSTLEHPAHLWWRQTIRGLLQQIDIAGDLDYATDVLYVMLDVRTIRFQRRNLGYDQQRVVDGLHATLNQLMC